MKILFYLMKRLWWHRKLSTSVKLMEVMVFAGISLSVAALLVALGVANGFEKEYKKGILDFNAHVLVHPEADAFLDPEKIQEALRPPTFPEGLIVSVTPYLLREGLLIHRGVIKGTLLKGIPNQGEGIRLGKALAEKLQLISAKGPSVKILIPSGSEISDQNTKRLPVSGTFESGLYEIDSQFALVDLQMLQQLFGVGPDFVGFQIKLKDPSLASEVADHLEETFGDWILVQDWIAMNRPLFDALELEKWAFRIILGLMVFVAICNLIGTLFLAIFRRKKTVAILQSLGLPRKKIRFLFTGQGILLGVGGLLFGILLGCVIGWMLQTHLRFALDPQVYFLEYLPISIEPYSIFIIAAFGLFLISVITWSAAKGCMKMPIREGLHGPG